MRILDDLLHPITPDQFLTDYHGRKPLHIPAQAGTEPGKAAILDWPRFNAMLEQTAYWTSANLKLVHNGQPIPAQQYCIAAQTQTGFVERPAPDRVNVLLSSGASLIADDVQTLTPELSVIADMLSRTFAASVGANVYCSFGGVQAFGTHFDLHDVFAVHLSGEKTWRLYENRADSPVAPPGDGDDPRPFYERARGRLMQEVRMKPGDVLYLPRGWHHDALADGDVKSTSLHVTFSVAPLYGRVIFNLLEQAAMQNPAFRAYLPPAHADGGEALRKHLTQLGKMLADLSALPEFRDEVAMAQERLSPRRSDYALPARKPLTLYRPTGLMPPRVTGPAMHAMGWAFSQPQFALEDLCAQFDFVPEPALRAAVTAADQAGALKRL